ncbi:MULTISPECIES: dienelactone hydrolase family protein [Comamonas]|uniref:dienelactone hydrolase family protein n=1 Tax=Comamonas TaxID=283 RepID=UPI00050F80B2|nr:MULTISPECIES: dienelactone hydrolase family protein [Comamonas]KGG86293.1 carboxymethylenebutenolidase [Comamonas thiooxydans]KGG97922.1 carboxymethylenebutenolidase [Comamonas thiooxydans]KGH06552.1 carboxymethylenebutenolidase [Comamonas thiooxydans]KGH08940.1 carboxymethylenebutenolidase [Comamonas thiooxydans]TZG12495.1 dienelactone hydrolase family protein [Comamonas thiooxydans]
MKYEDIAQDMQGLLGGRADARPSRRAALRTALGAGLGVGYACAAGPVMAQTAIKTPVDGLTAGEVSIDVKGFKLPAYRAMPAGRQNLPVVLVISEIFGVHEYIADTCRRLARAGYLAIAPDLFVRQGDPMAYAEMAKLMSEVIAKVPDAQVMGDLDAAVQWAGTQGGDVKKLAITGFCWGGRITWLYAAHAPLKAGVAWYGRLQGNKNDLQPSYPLELVGQLKAPVLGLYGGKDTGIPLESVEAMKAALKSGSAAARASEFVIFPDAPHAFHADYRPSYREQAAQDGWTRMLTWFNQHGVA